MRTATIVVETFAAVGALVELVEQGVVGRP
jgi:hypothetical protein